MLTPGERKTATYTCSECRRQIRTLADEYGDHGCICGWGPNARADDVRKYVKRCVDNGVAPDAFAFALTYEWAYYGAPGREIDELIAKELAKYEQRN
ncbi:hypothetical protein DFP94_101496 [Fontibacillus phaseoli]|uniref:Uncharacterized protein n=1 Tax=Fontibacillus phaseoli TaxID=1416533 RepID=A0A369BR19_9BACL|nr:hypothetical protein [Fontibacillus phaseoli]RCX22907.1 hypothetical protein DFP94_101496 [Fontibacillus phaseoli]